jgi:exosortase A-associated hydrolase 2
LTQSLWANFIGPAGRRILVVARRPVGTARGCILLVPPFGEEMNKSRRMLALVAQGLAARGFVAALPDLSGTGDSEGEFGESTWSQWRQDLQTVHAFFEEQGQVIRAALAVRTGCALIAEVAGQHAWNLSHTVFWQPVLDGARFLTQFLRLRVASSLMGGDRRESTQDLLSRFRSGETLEIAGYEVSPALAHELDKMNAVASLSPNLGTVHWIEVMRAEDGALSESARSAISKATERRVEIVPSTHSGEPFWSSTEIVTIPTLVERSVDILAA